MEHQDWTPVTLNTKTVNAKKSEHNKKLSQKSPNLDVKIEGFVESKLDNLLNETEILKNNELKNERNYKYQFNNDLFMEIFDFVYPQIEEITQKDLATSAHDAMYDRKV